MAVIDHVIVEVNDAKASAAFYVEVLGFDNGGQDGPFTVIRAGDACQLQLAPWGTKGGHHLAFALEPEEFRRTFARIQERAIPYGDTFDGVGRNAGPGRETGARGPGPTVYFFDPNRHLIEIRTYEG